MRSDVKDPDAWLDEEWLTQEDLKRYAEKWIVAYEGQIFGVGRTLEVAERRAWRTGKIPPGAELFIDRLPPRTLIF